VNEFSVSLRNRTGNELKNEADTRKKGRMLDLKTMIQRS